MSLLSLEAAKQRLPSSLLSRDIGGIPLGKTTLSAPKWDTKERQTNNQGIEQRKGSSKGADTPFSSLASPIKQPQRFESKIIGNSAVDAMNPAKPDEDDHPNLREGATDKKTSGAVPLLAETAKTARKKANRHSPSLLADLESMFREGLPGDGKKKYNPECAFMELKAMMDPDDPSRRKYSASEGNIHGPLPPRETIKSWFAARATNEKKKMAELTYRCL